MQSSPRLIDLDHVTARGIPVTVLPNLSADATAEHTVALLLAVLRRIPEGDRTVREGRWHQRQSMAGIGTSLTGETVGIVGCGTVGQGVARRLGGFDVRLRYTTRTRLTEQVERDLGLTHRSLDELVAEADVVVVTVALTPDTRGLIDAEVLRRMRPGAILVNTSRGAVPHAARYLTRRGARRGRRRGVPAPRWHPRVGLDVFEHEVTSTDRIGPRASLLELPNVVVTPHLGSATIETRERMAGRVVEDIETFLRGDRPPDLVDPDALSPGDA